MDSHIQVPLLENELLGKCVIIMLYGFLLFGCESEITEPEPVNPKSSFEVRVISPDGIPLEGVQISGGIDMYSYEVYTDSTGTALLPEYAWGERTSILTHNHFPRTVEELRAAIYTLNPTPERLDFLGEVDGRGVYFDETTLTTIAYQGSYNIYQVFNSQVSELASLPFPATTKHISIVGDKLWVSVHEDWIYCYSIQDPTNPQLLFEFNIPGYLKLFAVKGNLIVVCDSYGYTGSLRFHTYSADGSIEEKSRIDRIYTHEMTFIYGYLAVQGRTDDGYKIMLIDIDDPTSPVIVRQHLLTNCFTGKFYRHYAVLRQKPVEGMYPNRYLVIDLTVPFHPSTINGINAPGWLHCIIDEDIAICEYNGHWPTSVVLRGSITNGYSIAALVAKDTHYANEGNFPPYFLFGNGLWKLASCN